MVLFIQCQHTLYHLLDHRTSQNCCSFLETSNIYASFPQMKAVHPSYIWSTCILLPFAFNREAWTFFRTCLFFKGDKFPRQLYRLDQWKCLVWSTKQWMFVKETWHVLLTWSACLTKLTPFFRVLEAGCHCDFRKIDALKVNKFGRTYRTGTQTA